jgi:hypothetical protein
MKNKSTKKSNEDIGGMVASGIVLQMMPSLESLRKHGTVKDSFGKLSEGVRTAYEWY